MAWLVPATSCKDEGCWSIVYAQIARPQNDDACMQVGNRCTHPYSLWGSGDAREVVLFKEEAYLVCDANWAGRMKAISMFWGVAWTSLPSCVVNDTFGNWFARQTQIFNRPHNDGRQKKAALPTTKPGAVPATRNLQRLPHCRSPCPGRPFTLLSQPCDTRRVNVEVLPKIEKLHCTRSVLDEAPSGCSYCSPFFL